MASNRSIPSSAHGIIDAHPLFAMLTPDELTMLKSEGRLIAYRDGETMIEEHAARPGLFLILRGCGIAIINGTPAGRIEPGDVAGEISSARLSPAVATVVAEGDTEALHWSEDTVQMLCSKNPAFARALTDRALQRFRE